ncbi:MAG: hypothetical protein II826_04210 [Prevotella sp.]|nr:hypothetical protein [Prevotella sp.]
MKLTFHIIELLKRKSEKRLALSNCLGRLSVVQRPVLSFVSQLTNEFLSAGGRLFVS